MDFSKQEWIVSALEVIGKDEKVRRFAYVALIVAALFGLGSLGNLFTGLAALLN